MPRALTSPTGKRKTIAPVRPSAGIEALYHRRLLAEIDAMQRSIMWWITAAYKAAEPATMAQDRSAAAELNDAVARLTNRWRRRFAELANDLARWFVKGTADHADKSLKAALKKGGLTVKFKLTAAQNDVVQASVAENVKLIRSIPEQHFTQIQGMVMRATQTGRDMGTLTKELEHQFGVTKRRAAIIARDQSNKTTAAVVRTRQQEAGITQAVWQHSSAGKHPRPEHVAANGKVYDVAKGMFLEGVWTWPGREINCRCNSRSIIPGV